MSPQRGLPNDNANDNAPLLLAAHVGPLLRTLHGICHHNSRGAENHWGEDVSPIVFTHHCVGLGEHNVCRDAKECTEEHGESCVA